MNNYIYLFTLIVTVAYASPIPSDHGGHGEEEHHVSSHKVPIHTIHKHHYKKVPEYKIVKVDKIIEVKVPYPVKVPIKIPYPVVVKQSIKAVPVHKFPVHTNEHVHHKTKGHKGGHGGSGKGESHHEEEHDSGHNDGHVEFGGYGNHHESHGSHNFVGYESAGHESHESHNFGRYGNHHETHGSHNFGGYESAGHESYGYGQEEGHGGHESQTFEGHEEDESAEEQDESSGGHSFEGIESGPGGHESLQLHGYGGYETKDYDSNHNFRISVNDEASQFDLGPALNPATSHLNHQIQVGSVQVGGGYDGSPHEFGQPHSFSGHFKNGPSGFSSSIGLGQRW